MAIEFRCSHCNKLLRTPQGTGGQQAKCPQCGALSTIPAATTATPTSAEMMPPREPDFHSSPAADASHVDPRDNPYRAPTVDVKQLVGPPGPVTFQPTRIDLGDVLNKTWEIYKAQLGMCIVGTLLTGICAAVAVGVWFGLFSVLIDHSNQPVAALGGVVAFAGMFPIMAFFYLGLMRYSLAIARGQPPRIGDLFSAAPLTPIGAVVMALLTIGTAVGSIFLLVPGILFMMIFGLAPLMLLDQGANLSDSFRLSSAAMQGNKLTAFLLLLVITMISGVLGLFTCGLARIFTMPFMMLCYSVAYLCATGQATAYQPVYPGGERTFDAPGTQNTF